MTDDRTAAAAEAEREACAAIADAYAEENLAMATDTILADPVVSGRDRSEAGFAKAKDLMIEGCIHSSMYHAAKNIAEAIRKRGEARKAGE